MKRAIIIHCWEGKPDYCWYPWVKKELEAKGFQVQVPEMPETDMPKLSGWLPKLQEVVGSLDSETYLVGHSLGCVTIMRYLESLGEGQKIGGAVFVAGFTDDLGYKEISSFFKIPIDFEKMKKHCPHFVAIHSDNDPYVPLKHADIFKEKLNAKVITKNKMGHFSGPIENEKSCTRLPEVVDSIMAMVGHE